MAVDLVLDGRVATVTLNTPENRNALSVRLRTELAAALDEAMENATVSAIVLTGAGPVFCAGADLKEGNLAEGPSLPSILSRLEDGPKPVVVALNGPARAGGIGLIAAADLAFAPETATFAFTEVRIGVVPAIISVPVLPRLSSRAAARYFLTGEVFDAAAAVAAGLLTACGDVDELVHSALDAICLGAPAALAATKQLLREIPSMEKATAMAYAEQLSATFFASDDAAEGRAAFADKRPPRWAT